MRVGTIIWILLVASSAAAEPTLDAGTHAAYGQKWLDSTQYQKAIEQFEQAYQLQANAIYLLWMADGYERLAGLATKTPAEIMECKQRALELYKVFVKKAPNTEPRLNEARARIEPLHQEIEELRALMAEQAASLKAIQSDTKQLVVEVRALRELILRWMRGERTAIPTIVIR